MSSVHLVCAIVWLAQLSTHPSKKRSSASVLIVRCVAAIRWLAERAIFGSLVLTREKARWLTGRMLRRPAASARGYDAQRKAARLRAWKNRPALPGARRAGDPGFALAAPPARSRWNYSMIPFLSALCLSPSCAAAGA